VPYGWNHFVELTAEQMKIKERAIAAYASQNTGDFDPAHLARQHAEYLGARVNVKYVEQYATVRRVV
jgi:hypothetical protein